MPTGKIGLAFYRQGWVGSTIVTKVSDSSTAGIQITNPASAVSYGGEVATGGRGLMGSSFALSISAAGLFTFSADAAFNLTFANNAGTRMGFANASYTGAATYTGETTPAGTFWPYTEDAFFYTNVFRVPIVSGVATESGGVWHRTPGTDLKTPSLAFDISKADLMTFIGAYGYLDTPAKVDLVSNPVSITTFFCGGVSIMENDAITGFSSVDLEIAT